MGIRGARSLMDEDPSRYTETFTWNWEDTNDTVNNADGNTAATLGVLVDAKSLLYHLILAQEKLTYASPATVNEICTLYLQRLIQVVRGNADDGNGGGGVHVFFDGLPPKEKLSTHLERMSEQAANADKLARGRTSDAPKLLHNLAEAAFVEAVETEMQASPSILHLHRPSVGEGEAHICQWLLQNPNRYSQSVVISEDTDFLVYQSCQGFIIPSSIQFGEQNGRVCLQGRHYLRSKFLNSFLGTSSTSDTTIMTTVVALAGCDYDLGKEAMIALEVTAREIVKSDIGGLRPKQRNNPSAAGALLAILRAVAHYHERGERHTWQRDLCRAFGGKRADTVEAALESIHSIYYYTLQMTSNPDIENIPDIVEVRRLIQHGVVYCQPVIETFKARTSEQNKSQKEDFDPVGIFEHALVPCPPLTTQIAQWSERYSYYDFPYLTQIRARLYSYIRLQIFHGRIPAGVPPGDFWTSTDPCVREASRYGNGNNVTMKLKNVKVPEHGMISAMFDTITLLESDDHSVDRALAFCLFGTPQQLATLRLPGTMKYGTIIVASLMLPFNLAFLYLMMATAPAELSQIANAKLRNEEETYSELKQVFPMLSVATAHANLLISTISSLWPEKAMLTSLASRGINISATFQHDNAVIIWDSMRDGRNLEYLKANDTFISEDSTNVKAFLDHCFGNLAKIVPNNDPTWETCMAEWLRDICVAYKAWWDVFNLDEFG